MRAPKMREWAMFRDSKGARVQLHCWQQRGAYQVGRYGKDGAPVMLGRFVDLDAVIELPLPSER